MELYKSILGDPFYTTIAIILPVVVLFSIFKKLFKFDIILSIICLMSFSIAQNLDLDKEDINRAQILIDNIDIDLESNKGRELTEDAFKKWKKRYFIFKSSEYYTATSDFFATKAEAREKAIVELSFNIKSHVSSSSEHSFEELSLDNNYSISENYYSTISTITDEVIINPSTIYIINGDNSYSAFMLKHKIEHELDKIEGIIDVMKDARKYLVDFESEKKYGNYTNAFKNLCNGYEILDSYIYENSDTRILFNDFKNKLIEFIGKIKLKRIRSSFDDKKIFFPFKEYEDFIHIQFKYEGKYLKNFPLILECDNCLVEGWENLITKNKTTDNISILNIDIESFLTTSSGQTITIYPDVFPIDNADNKFSFNTDERKKEFNVSDKIIFSEVKISNSANEPIDDDDIKIAIVDECNNEPEKYNYESKSQSQNNWVLKISEENVLELELNKKRNVFSVSLIYRISGSVKASAEREFIEGLFNAKSEKLISGLIKDLYDDYDRDNNFVKVKLSLAENTILKILSPHYNNDLTERKNVITGRNNEIILRKGQKYSFQFLYNSSLGKQVFYTLSDKIFTKKGETLLDPLNEDFRFPVQKLKMPIRLKGINNYSLSIYSSKSILPFGGWKLEEAFHKSNDREQSVEVQNDKKYKVTLLKNGYKEYNYEDDASVTKSSALMYFALNEYNKNSMIVPLIKIGKNNLQRPNSYDYMKYLTIPGFGQREVMHNSKFNWRKFESYILIASSCYLGWEFSKAYSTYNDSKGNYLDLQNKYSLLTENQIDTEHADSVEEDVINMYDSMERNHNDLKASGIALISLYVFNFADIVFSINFIN